MIDIPISFLVSIACVSAILSFLALSINISWGFNRILNFGIVGFFAIGSFTTAVITSPAPYEGAKYTIGLGLPIPLGIICGALVAGAFATILGLIAIRLKGHYLGVGSFAFAEFVLIVSEQEEWLTGGNFGIQTVPRMFGGDVPFISYQLFYLILTIVLLLLTLYALDKVLAWSPFGRVLRGIGDSELGASMLGKSSFRYRTICFAISGMVAGFAGALYAHYFGFSITTQFYAFITWTAWVAMLVGGSGNNRAVLIGSIIVFFGLMQLVRLAPISEANPTLFTSARDFVMGALLIAIMRYRPDGLFKEVV